MMEHPKCPYCGYELSDVWEYGPVEGDSIEIECEECEKMFLLAMCTEIRFSVK